MLVKVIYQKKKKRFLFMFIYIILLFLASLAFSFGGGDMHFPKHVYQLKARIVFKNINLI